MQNQTEGIIVLDSNCMIQSVNHAAEIIFNKKKDDLLGHDLMDFIDSEMPGPINDIITGNTNTPEKWHQFQISRHNEYPTRFYFAFNEANLNGEKYYVVVILKTLSEYGITSDDKIPGDSEKVFKNAFINSSIGMALVDADQMIIQINQAFLNIVGYTEEELVGSYIKDITLERDIIISLEQHNKMVNGDIDHYQFQIRYIHKNGKIIWALLNVSAVRDQNNKFIHAITLIQDITEARTLSAKLAYHASHDELTKLVNRREFENRIERIVNTASMDKSEHALCYIDLDQFKIINDTCGHIAGDELLRQLSALMLGRVRQRDTLARLGGDEFGLLMEHCPIEQAKRVANVLLAVIQEFRFTWDNRTFSISASIGLVPITENTSDITELLRHADTACYAAKNSGRNRVQVYYSSDIELARLHGDMRGVEQLNHALENDLLVLYGQPIKHINRSHVSENTHHYEILVRIKEESGNIILPGAFLPAAERYNMISKVDEWVVNNVFAWFEENKALVSEITCFSINLSGQSVGNQDFYLHVKKLLDECDVPAQKVCFEITETSAIANLSNAQRFIDSIKEMGCLFSLDDFGSGLSSFAYLKNLPVDYLKIDGIFIKDLISNPIDYAMVKSINDIGHVMGIKTIAEFVENEETLIKLEEIGIDYAQGYGIGLPLPIEDIEIN